MKIINTKKQKEKNRAGSIVAGVAGAVVVAGVAVAATMALKDEKNRKKVKKAMVGVKDQALDYVNNFKTEHEITKEKGIVEKVIKTDKKKIEERK